MTHLRQAMLDELQRRNYATPTVDSYIHAVERLAKHFKRQPDQVNQDHLRTYQAYLLRERKLAQGWCGCMSQRSASSSSRS